MLKKSILVGAVATLLATGVHAGEIKVHAWPTQFVYLEMTTIPAVMDIGFFIRIKDQDKLQIKLVQDSLDIHRFAGCVDMIVEANFSYSLTASIVPTGAVPGDYSVSLTPTSADAGTATIKVCAELKNADLAAQIAGSKDVQVATVKIKVAPI
jgi:hypothetical protein